MNIIIGSINLLGVIGVGIAIAIVWSDNYWVDWTALTVLWIVFAVLLIFSLPSIIAGIYAVQRKSWAIALLGSIASFLTWFIIGLIPLILIALSKDEFGTSPGETSHQIPLELAKERYAKGEISKEEFEQIKGVCIN
ncbi:MAG: SHOCT domain-containing protein [Dehalococcoidia bacterium]|nr:MAG: SHOCT domain-containing protein [Dehalococcoidia bacterium]